MLDVAILIPALDEEASVGSVIEGVPRAGPGWRVREVVVADNGSRDRTAVAAQAAGATVVVEPRRGYGAACLAGIARLSSRPPGAVVFLDADGSDDAGQLGELLEPLVARRAELVIGARDARTAEPGALTPVQRFGNRLATRLLALAFGARATDLGPFRAIRWEALDSLGMRDRDFGWTVEMQARAARAGRRVVEVPVRYRRRRAGRSKVAGTVTGSIAAGAKILLTIARVRLGG